MAKQLTPRGKAMRWLSTHRGLTEQPYGSNWDNRVDGISAAIKRCGFSYGVPWCGVWHYNALRAAGVHGISSRQASVGLIEDDARARRAPYGRGWTTDIKQGLRGDAVVLFGRGIHVETLRSNAWIYRKFGKCRTEGGNTTSGNAGDQANGGGSFARFRNISDIHGLGLVNYPGS